MVAPAKSGVDGGLDGDRRRRARGSAGRCRTTALPAVIVHVPRLGAADGDRQAGDGRVGDGDGLRVGRPAVAHGQRVGDAGAGGGRRRRHRLGEHARRRTGRSVLLTVAVLFAELGSVTPTLTVAVLLSEAALKPEPSVHETVAVIVWFGPSEAIVHDAAAVMRARRRDGAGTATTAGAEGRHRADGDRVGQADVRRRGRTVVRGRDRVGDGLRRR